MHDMFLPIVKPEIAGSVEREVFDQVDIKYAKAFLKKLDKDNPTIAVWIRQFSKTTKDRMGAVMCGLMVYRLLESQSEANRMNYEFNLQ